MNYIFQTQKTENIIDNSCNKLKTKKYTIQEKNSNNKYFIIKI